MINECRVIKAKALKKNPKLNCLPSNKNNKIR